MANCKKFFDELAACLLASDCANKHKTKPSECLTLLLKEKAMSKYEMGDLTLYQETGFKKTESNKDTIAPVECAMKHQSYVECKVALMNPRSRFRGPYGAHTSVDNS
jgi:hypothetical protein